MHPLRERMTMPKVILSGFIIVPERDMPSVLAELPNHLELTRREPGCLAFEVLRDTNVLNRFTVYEVFDSQASFDAHQGRIRGSGWGKVSVNVERHYKIETL